MRELEEEDEDNEGWLRIAPSLFAEAGAAFKSSDEPGSASLFAEFT